jgi:hypothetical protein
LAESSQHRCSLRCRDASRRDATRPCGTCGSSTPGRLRILGYQVHSTTGTAGGYRLGAGAALPPLPSLHPPPAAGLLKPDGEDASILETGADSLHELAAFLGSLEVAFTVIEPPELRDLLDTLADRYKAATR